MPAMHRTRFAALALLMSVPAPIALAQGLPGAPAEQEAEAKTKDAAAIAVLEASADAIKATEGFGAQFRMFGEGSDLIKSTMPSMSGRLIFGTATGDEGGRRVIHMIGEARDTNDSDSYPFDFTRTADTLTWTDDDQQKIFVRRAKPEPRTMPGAARMVHLANLLEEDPFAASLEMADGATLASAQAVAGETCDVVELSIPKGSKASHTSERWFISKSDRLPRRVELVTDAGMIKFSLITELSGLSAGRQAPSLLDVRRPEGYEVDEPAQRRPGAMPATKTGTAPGNVTRETTQTATRPAERPARPANRAAPVFTFADDAGGTIDNNSQLGRVTVLYYWGTWCVPCQAVSPEISKVAEHFDGQPVDVFGLAIRERDPQAPRDLMSQKSYKHRLVLGAESTTGPFRVRVYPTIVVIDKQGNIAYKGSPNKDRTPEALGDEITDAVQDALNAS